MFNSIHARPIWTLLACAVAVTSLAADAPNYAQYEALSPSQITYKVSATTAGPRENFLPGTRQDISLKIHGSSPGAKPIEQTLKGPFTSGETREFPEINGSNIGFACSIELNTNGPDGWLPKEVKVGYYYQDRPVGLATFSNSGNGRGWIDTEGCGQEIGTNLAVFGTATQSSTFQNSPMADAAHGIDGDTNGAWRGNSLTHTGANPNAWWQVKLPEESTISGVVIWNRTDCCANKLANFNVSVLRLETRPDPADRNKTIVVETIAWSFDSLFSDGKSFPDTSPTGDFPQGLQLQFPEGTKGRIVRVQLNGTDYLHLAEVQVLGFPNSRAPAACEKKARYYPDEIIDACNDMKRKDSSAAQAKLEMPRPREDDFNQVLNVDVGGFIQNAAGQQGDVTLRFVIANAAGNPEELPVNTYAFRQGVKTEISRPVAVRSNGEAMTAKMVVPYVAFNTLRARDEPYEIAVVAVLSTGGATAQSEPAIFKIRIQP